MASSNTADHPETLTSSARCLSLRRSLTTMAQSTSSKPDWLALAITKNSEKRSRRPLHLEHKTHRQG
eukprot:210885-Prorocentrum_minimum.AAC.1